VPATAARLASFWVIRPSILGELGANFLDLVAQELALQLDLCGLCPFRRRE
jgi:hypothetical protein